MKLKRELYKNDWYYYNKSDNNKDVEFYIKHFNNRKAANLFVYFLYCIHVSCTNIQEYNKEYTIGYFLPIKDRYLKYGKISSFYLSLQDIEKEL